MSDEGKVHAAEQARIDVIARVSPAVVCILEENRTGGGSGVIIDADGYGLTNYHVVASMMSTRKGLAGLADGKVYAMEVLGVDPTGDLAMFRLAGRPRFAFVPLGDSDQIRVGDWVMAMGNPFLLAEDFTPTVTLGIVSGVHRYQWGADGNRLVYTDCIQVDASINPGNSGGPLFDAQGRLIGINGRAAFEERGRINVGLGFAISVNQIRRFLPGLRAGLLVEHGSLGATVSDAGYRHVVFDRVLADSAAARAGIRIGDRLHSFAGRPIHSANQFANLLGTYPAGWPVDVVFSSPPEGERRRARLSLDRLPVEVKGRHPPVDPNVTSRAAASAPAELAAVGPAPSRNAFARAVETAMSAIVKLYGAGAAMERGYGSGVLIGEDGLLVTTLSLLLESDDVRAVTADGRLYRADVQARDPNRQLALLKLRPRPEESDAAQPPSPLRSLRPGTSRRIEPGAWVLALGNPFKVAEGEEPVSVLKGVFSVRTRMDARHRLQDFPYAGEVLVVDAVIGNPGAQGGALIDLDGNWIGLIGKGVHSNLTSTRLSYALPIEEVLAFLDEARRGALPGTAASAPSHAAAGEKGYHGIRLFPLAYRQALPFVERVELGSPAERAGLRKEDLIISANGTAIPNARAFHRLCDRLSPGEELTLVIKRGQALLTLRLTLEKPPP